MRIELTREEEMEVKTDREGIDWSSHEVSSFCESAEGEEEERMSFRAYKR